MAKTIEYCVKHGLSYLQGIEPNEQYCKTGVAPTMGAKHSFCEYKTVWEETPKYFEPITLANYIKVIFEENRWETRDIVSFYVLQKYEDSCGNEIGSYFTKSGLPEEYSFDVEYDEDDNCTVTF